MTFCFLAFASSFSVLADDQTAAQQTADGQVVTLTQLVDQALGSGPDILLSNASLASAQAQYASAAARNAFTLDGNAGLTHSDPGSGSGPGSSPSDAVSAGLSLGTPYAASVNLSASHTLQESTPLSQSTSVRIAPSMTVWDGYAGGSGLASAKQAQISLQQKQSSEDSNRKDIIFNVKQQYYTLLAQQRQISILEQTLLKRQEELKKTQALYNAQSANQIDLKQARINQTQAELDLARARDNLEITREKLSALVGWPIDKPYTVAEVEDLPTPSLDVAAAIATALSQRADMRQAAMSAASADISLALARAKASPTVSVSGGLNLSVDWGTTVNTNVSWNAGVTVTMPVLDAGAAAAGVAQAQAQNDTLKIQQQKLAASIATSVRSAIYDLRDLLARADLAQASLELAQNQYDLAKLQFASGVTSNLDVLGASVSFTLAQVSLAKARSDAQLGVLALQNALGD
jgi:outer membrane protein TolC